MNTPGPIPVPMGANDETPYEFKAWPAWRYNSEGKGAVFNSPEEVPEGWMTLDELNSVKADFDVEPAIEPDESPDETPEPPLRAEEQPRQLTAEQRTAAVDKLIDDYTQKDLVAQLELMNEQRAEEDKDEIEFSAQWPKLKLAEAIVDNGGPLED